jgi:hypothetical protein
MKENNTILTFYANFGLKLFFLDEIHITNADLTPAALEPHVRTHHIPEPLNEVTQAPQRPEPSYQSHWYPRKFGGNYKVMTQLTLFSNLTLFFTYFT